jgi:hypothetical protein
LGYPEVCYVSSSSNKTTRFAPPPRAAKRAWSAENMTPMAMLLRQRPALFRSAMEQTRDVNEANIVVHGVMARALSRAGDAEHDLGASLACALQARSDRLAVTL